jgi:transposase InsO family protein
MPHTRPQPRGEDDTPPAASSVLHAGTQQESAERRRAWGRVRSATNRLHSVAARVNGAGLLEEGEIQQLRRLLKRGRRSPTQSARMLEEVAMEYDRRTEALERRLGPSGSGEQKATSPAAQAEENIGGQNTAPVGALGASSGAEAAAPVSDTSRTAPVAAQPLAKVPLLQRRLDELPPHQLERFAGYRELMTYLDDGVDPHRAMELAGVRITLEWLHTLRTRYQEDGPMGLFDGRLNNGKRLFGNEVVGLTEALAFRYPGAGPKVIHEHLAIECARRELAVPSYSWVREHLREGMSKSLRLLRDGGFDLWERNAAPRAVAQVGLYGNHIWYPDHCLLDHWVRVLQRNGEWVAVPVWVTAIMDVFTRAIAGIVVSTRTPDAWTTAIAFRHAVRPKEHPAWLVRGLPAAFVPDNGKDFRAKSVDASMRALGVKLTFTRPRTPNQHGPIESFFRALDRGLLRGLPGHKSQGMVSQEAAQKRVHLLPELPGLRTSIINWTVEVYLQRVHEGISSGSVDRCPQEYWAETVRLLEPESDQLDVLLLKSDMERTVGNTGIRLKWKGTPRMVFWHPRLAFEYGIKVRIRYNPEDLESILVYDAGTGEFLCEAWNIRGSNGRYSAAEVVSTRRKVRACLKKRINEYHRLLAESDRMDTAAWEEAKRIAAELARQAEAREDAPVDAEAPAPRARQRSLPEGVIDLIAALERADREKRNSGLNGGQP